MEKIYYDKTTGYLCNRYPKDIQVKEDTPFIEVREEEAEKTYICDEGTFWAVINGKLQLVEDKEVTSSKEWKIRKIEEQIREKEEYLTKTDYIISKINEAKIEDDDLLVNELKGKYIVELSQRKVFRNEINILQNQLKGLK